MKRLRLTATVQSSSHQLLNQSAPRFLVPFCQRCTNARHNSTSAAESAINASANVPPSVLPSARPARQADFLSSVKLEVFKSPPPQRALKSAKLAALHARLALSPHIPLQSLARTLVDRTADPDAQFNNSSLAIHGEHLLGYYCSEHLICNYPRLPIEVLWAAQRAYIGPEVLLKVIAEWGVDSVVAPGGEVDPGLLQFKQKQQTQLHYVENQHARRREEEREALLPASLRKAARTAARTAARDALRRTSENKLVLARTTHKLLVGDQFGQLDEDGQSNSSQYTTPEMAASRFVRAITALIHLYSGQDAAKQFFKNHFLSRSLDMSKLFYFDRPHRDLTLLCKREGFEVPVARLISETGRLSAHPVFVVGVFSGRDKLGEGVGGSLPEAKLRAAVAALKSWYLYKPLEVSYPSDADTIEGKAAWKPNLVDCGEVVMY